MKRKTESLIIGTQNNTIWKNYVKAKIDKSQQHCKCRSCGDRDKTINHIISEYSNLAQEDYKARHNLVGKVIHKGLSKTFWLDQTMINPECVLKNESHKLLWDIEIKTDRLFLIRRPNLVKVIKTNNLPNSRLWRPGFHRVKRKRKER